MGNNGKLMGARMPPTALSLFCNPSCAISGYITGDPTDGSLEGPALIACLLNCFCGSFCLGGIYALLAWKPDPSQIKNDGTMRTLNNRFCAVCCLHGCFVISFWEKGDICTGCCEGDACLAFILNIAGYFLGFGCIGDCYTCCCWQPNPAKFLRTPEMHGERAPKPGEAVQQAAGMVGAVVAQAVAVATPVIAGNAQEKNDNV
jgi:hypothetical protein